MVDIHEKLNPFRVELARATSRREELRRELDTLTPLLVEQARLDATIDLHRRYQALIAELFLLDFGRGELKAAILKTLLASHPDGVAQRALRLRFKSLSPQIKRLREARLITDLANGNIGLTRDGEAAAKLLP